VGSLPLRCYARAVRERVPLLVGLILLSLAILFGSFAVGRGIRDRNRNDTISVTGSAKKHITSDYVVWDVSVSSQLPTPQAAAKQLAGWSNRVRSFLGEQGALPGEITVEPISTQVQTQNENGSGKITGYNLTRTFEVRSPRVQQIAELIDKSSALLNEGVPIAAQPPQYVYTKLPQLRPSLLADATRDALERAKVLVGATGGHLGKLRSVDVGVFQVTSPNSTEVSDYGVYDTSTVDKDVTAVVNVSFALR
jgi:hypothetical protein